MSNSEGPQFEKISEASFVPPAVESFSSPERAKQVWPESITSDIDFIEQTANQRETLRALTEFYATVPKNISPLQSLESGDMSAESLTALYKSLTSFMCADPAHERLILYIPFEFLDGDESNITSTESRRAVADFKQRYEEAWARQLRTHDVRANFVDGDVLEEELRDGDFPRVVKATHLIPELVKKKLLTISEVIARAEHSRDSLLVQGISEALLVAAAQGLLGAADHTSLEHSASYVLRDTYRQITKNTPETNPDGETPEAAIPDILTTLQKKLLAINIYEPEESTAARTAWLRHDARQRALKETSSVIASALLRGTASQLPENMLNDETTVTVFIDAIRLASQKNADVYRQYAQWLAYWDNDEQPEIIDALTKLYAHLHAESIVSDETLKEHAVEIPKLEGPFSENLKQIEPFLKEVNTMTAAIEEDQYLSQYVYPTSLLFGSQLKGYGTKNADADVAVFIKPGTPRSEKTKLEASLANIFNHEKIGGKAEMFWLEESSDGLGVHDFEDKTKTDGDSTWTHLLFGASWHGNQDVISELHEKLLSNYLYDPGTLTHGKSTRERWLEELERDTLQYRLLHKGYERYYPVTPVDSIHAKAIDGQSAFYDTGFRRMATQLFVSRVFLPNLGKK